MEQLRHDVPKALKSTFSDQQVAEWKTTLSNWIRIHALETLIDQEPFKTWVVNKISLGNTYAQTRKRLLNTNGKYASMKFMQIVDDLLIKPSHMYTCLERAQVLFTPLRTLDGHFMPLDELMLVEAQLIEVAGFPYQMKGNAKDFDYFEIDTESSSSQVGEHFALPYLLLLWHLNNRPPLFRREALKSMKDLANASDWTDTDAFSFALKLERKFFQTAKGKKILQAADGLEKYLAEKDPMVITYDMPKGKSKKGRARPNKRKFGKLSPTTSSASTSTTVTPRAKSANIKKETKPICSYCNKSGHTEERCYKKKADTADYSSGTNGKGLGFGAPTPSGHGRGRGHSGGRGRDRTRGRGRGRGRGNSQP